MGRWVFLFTPLPRTLESYRMTFHASSRVAVIPSEISHVYALAAAMREADRNEITALGFDPLRLLRANFRTAHLRKTAFVDGKIAAMWGVCGSFISDRCWPYLVTTAMVEEVPVATVKVGKKAVCEMLAIHPHLEGEVAASYTGACRLLTIMGFELGEARPLGPHGALFRRFAIGRIA